MTHYQLKNPPKVWQWLPSYSTPKVMETLMDFVTQNNPDDLDFNLDFYFGPNLRHITITLSDIEAVITPNDFLVVEGTSISYYDKEHFFQEYKEITK